MCVLCALCVFVVDFVLSISSQTNVIPPQRHKGHKALTKELLDLKDTIREGIFVPDFDIII